MKRSIQSKIFLLICTVCIFTATTAQVSITGSSAVTENFDGIGTSATATLPSNWKMSAAGQGSSSLAFTNAGNLTATNQAASSGTPVTGARYNWGNGTTTSDRAIGFMTSGSYVSPNSIMVQYRNNGSTNITDITISFDIERYRVNSANASLTFFTSTDGTTWTAQTTGDIATSAFPTGTSTYTFTGGTVVSRTVNLSSLSIAVSSDLYLMWVMNTTGASSQGIGLDNVSLTATFAPAAGTSLLTSGAGAEPTNFSSLINTQVAAVQNYDIAIQDDGASPATDATPTQISQIRFSQGTGNDIANWTQAILGAELSDGTNTLTGTINASNITFSAIPNGIGQLGHIADNATKTYTLKIWLNTDVGSLKTSLDGSNIVFRNTNADFTITGSQLATSQDVNSGSSNNAVSVIATAIGFAQNASNADVNNNMSPAPAVQAIDANGNRDLDFTSSISITSTGTLNTTPQTVSATSGLATFTINHTATGTSFTLTATTSGFSNITSASFNVNIPSAAAILWSSAGGSAWLTASNWTGATIPSASQVAQFGVNPTATTIGINMNGTTNNGANNQIVGGIEITNARSASLNIGNSAGSTAGNLTLGGVTINAIENTVLRNNSSQLLTIQANQSSAMGLILNNITNNIIQINGTGGVTISSAISGSNPITKKGSGSGILQLTGANTYTGLTTVTEGTLQLNRTGGTTVPTTNNFTVDGGTLRISSNQTLNNLTLSSGNLTIDVGVTLTINGTFTFTGGTITNNGTLSYGSSSTLTYNTGDSRTAGVEWPSTGQPANISLLNNSSITLSGNRTIGNLTTTTGTQLVIGSNTLILTGTFSGGGTLSGGTSSNLTIGGNAGTISFTSGARSLGNLIIGTGTNASLTLGSALSITTDGSITFNAAGTKSLQTGGNQLLLLGIEGSCAYIGNLNGATVTGTITIQRFVKGVARRWRFWGSPFSNATFEDVRDDIYITGAGSGTILGTLNSNGFDATTTNAPSVYSYNETATGNAQQGWEALTNNTSSLTNQTIVAGKGYRIFVRGDRSDVNRLSGTNTTQNQVIIQVSGTINSGSISLPVTYTSTGDATADGWNFVANPYPAAYDWNAFYDDASTTKTNIDPTIWILDATTSSYKSYNANSSGDLTGGLIPMGSGFWVKANGASPSLILEERFKSTIQPIVLHKSAANELALTLQLDSITKDTWILLPETASSDSLDGYDIVKLQGSIALHSATQNGSLLALDARPMQPTDTIDLYCSGGNRNYSLKVNSIPTDGYEYTLLDRKTGQTQLLQLGTSYTFSTNQLDSTSFGKRFAIVCNTPQPLPVTLITFEAKTLPEHVSLSWYTAMESMLAYFEIERAGVNKQFETIGSVKAIGNSNTMRSYSYHDANAYRLGNEFYYRLKMMDEDGTHRYSSIQHVQFQKMQLANEVYCWPNPASDEVKISANDAIAFVSIYNANGALMTRTQQTTIQTTEWDNGLYHIQVVFASGQISSCKLVKE